MLTSINGLSHCGQQAPLIPSRSKFGVRIEADLYRELLNLIVHIASRDPF